MSENGLSVGASLAILAAGLGTAVLVNHCSKQNVAENAGRIDTALNDLKAETTSGDWGSLRMPQGIKAVVIQTNNYVINFAPVAPQDPNGIMLIFYKGGGKGSHYGIVNSKGKVIEGSASVASDGINEVKEKFPRLLGTEPIALERAQ